MKIVAISDTHGNDKWHRQIPECDLLIHSGDICPMYDHDTEYQIKWISKHFIPQLSRISAKKIVFVGGNHDFGLERIYRKGENESFQKSLPEHIHYLMDSSVEIEGLKIWGTPWVVRLGGWAFNRNDHDLSHDVSNAYEVFSKIPEGYDFLVSHGPAKGYSDTIMERGRTDPLGSEILFQEVKRARPKWVLTGHIHSANHVIQELVVGNDVIKLACTSLLDESYKLHYPPMIIDI